MTDRSVPGCSFRNETYSSKTARNAAGSSLFNPAVKTGLQSAFLAEHVRVSVGFVVRHQASSALDRLEGKIKKRNAFLASEMEGSR